MKHYMAQLRRRATERLLAGTTFCDECGIVCTPACRVDGHLDRIRSAASRAGIPTRF